MTVIRDIQLEELPQLDNFRFQYGEYDGIEDLFLLAALMLVSCSLSPTKASGDAEQATNSVCGMLDEIQAKDKPYNSSAQNLGEMSSTQREKFLIELSTEVIKTFGAGYYQEMAPTIHEGVFESTDNRLEVRKNVGREYYEVIYPYDKSKEALEFDFSAKVRIWKDTGVPCDVIFGNGYGKNFFFSSYKEQAESLTAIEQVPYEQVTDSNEDIWTK